MKSLIALATAVTAGVALTASAALASSDMARPDNRAMGPRSELAVVSPVDLATQDRAAHGLSRRQLVSEVESREIQGLAGLDPQMLRA